MLPILDNQEKGGVPGRIIWVFNMESADLSFVAASGRGRAALCSVQKAKARLMVGSCDKNGCVR
jgi:hypothetical protein